MTELRPLPCVVAGGIEVLAPPPDVSDRLRRALSFPHPDYVRALRASRPTAGIEDRYHCTTETPESLLVPRGAVDVVRRVLADRGYRPEWRDDRSTGDPVYLSHSEERHARRPRDYQEEAVDRALRLLQGTVVLPPGGGKTTVGAEVIARVFRTALVVVHTEDLADQWEETIRRAMGISVGRVGRGEARFGSVTVAVVNTLDAVLRELPGLGRAFGVVVVDECHFAPAVTFQRVLMRLPGRWRVGLTATPEREDGMSSLVDWSFGARLVERDARDLVRRGYLTPPEVRTVSTAFQFDVESVPKRRRMAALQQALVRDADRNRLVAAEVAREQEAGEQVLVLSNSVEQCVAIDAELGALGVESRAVVTGRSRRAERKAHVAAFRDGALRVLLATSLADYGVDWPALSRAVLALPGSSRGRTIQRLGRLMRNYPGKRPVLIDVVDAEVPTLVRRWEERRRVYRKADLAVQGDE